MEIGILYLSHAMLVLAELIVDVKKIDPSCLSCSRTMNKNVMNYHFQLINKNHQK